MTMVVTIRRALISSPLSTASSRSDPSRSSGRIPPSEERGRRVRGGIENRLHHEERADRDGNRCADRNAQRRVAGRGAAGGNEPQLGARAHVETANDVEVVAERDGGRSDSDEDEPPVARV